MVASYFIATSLYQRLSARHLYCGGLAAQIADRRCREVPTFVNHLLYIVYGE
jgi:hypothetical protein